MTLYRDHISKHLTEPDSELAKQRRDTHPGMAHFAGTGPLGMTCRECIHFQHSRHDYYQSTGQRLIKPATCAKYRALRNGVKGRPVPDNAMACKYFEFNREAPKRFA